MYIKRNASAKIYDFENDINFKAFRRDSNKEQQGLE